MDPVSDEALLQQFLGGDPRALAELARRYEAPLLGLATGLLNGNTDMAADAVQETWLRVIRYGHSFESRSSLKTWLYRIAINQCKEAKARAAKGPTPRRDPPATSTPAHHEPDEHELLRKTVAELRPDRRIVLLLCFHAGMTHETAAEILGLPVGTLKTRLRAAMTELRARLNQGVPL